MIKWHIAWYRLNFIGVDHGEFIIATSWSCDNLDRKIPILISDVFTEKRVQLRHRAVRPSSIGTSAYFPWILLKIIFVLPKIKPQENWNESYLGLNRAISGVLYSEPPKIYLFYFLDITMVFRDWKRVDGHNVKI